MTAVVVKVMDFLDKHHMCSLSVQYLLGPPIIEKMHCIVLAMKHACFQASKAGLLELMEVDGLKYFKLKTLSQF